MMAWAVVSSLTALAKDFKGLLLVRDGQQHGEWHHVTALFSPSSAR